MSELLTALRNICDESGMSNTTIGELCGLDRATVYQIRTCVRATTLDKIEDIFDALGYDIYIKRRKE